MATESSPPRLVGAALRAAAALTGAPVIGDALCRNLVHKLGLDALDDLPLGDRARPPATLARPVVPTRRGGER
ncbi:MAG: hypothetical protein AB2A00_41490 [Myxococcota bacterium]